jgi:hypothetical protein
MNIGGGGSSSQANGSNVINASKITTKTSSTNTGGSKSPLKKPTNGIN